MYPWGLTYAAMGPHKDKLQQTINFVRSQGRNKNQRLSNGNRGRSANHAQNYLPQQKNHFRL